MLNSALTSVVLRFDNHDRSKNHAMPSLSLSDRLIWFAHCPKAGGTSVEQAMVATWGQAIGHLQWGWDNWWHQGGWQMADPPNSPQHLIWADASVRLPRAPDAAFALVRDPVARITSEYRWQRLAAKKGGRRSPRAGKALSYLPFSAWLRLMLEVATINPYAFDNHFRPQTEFIPDFARVFRLEDGMEHVRNWLLDITQTPLAVPLGHALATRSYTQISDADAARISDFFAADYARFGYHQPPTVNAASPFDRWAKKLAPSISKLERQGRL